MSSAGKLVLITTAPTAMRVFFRRQLAHLRSRGFEVHAVSGPGDVGELPVPWHPVPLRRRISIPADLYALVCLWIVLRRLRPAIVHSHTPKAGMLGMLAAAAAGVPVRFYTINGLPLTTRGGWFRRLLVLAEQVSCRVATQVFCVSESLRRQVEELGLCSAAKVRVIGRGGSHGVDMTLFDPGRHGAGARAGVRARLGIPMDALVIAFIGRLVRDKGIEDLAAAWRLLRERLVQAHLLVCGSWESEDPVSPETRSVLADDSRVHITSEKPERMPAIYSAADICVLPSYREGLPNVLLEAAAMQLPVVATRIPGCTDVVANGSTGLLVEPAEPGELALAIEGLARDPRRVEMGIVARRLVHERFAEEAHSKLLLQEYRRALDVLRCPGISRSKRLFDLAAAALVLLLALPLIAVVFAATWWLLGTPVLFGQARAGWRGQPFTLYKIRTMRELCDASGRLLPDDVRLTRFGRFLRATSIDELPQLWNVLRGDMSLVGPRPLLVDYLPRYTALQMRRHEVRPGLTGWAQVHGRNDQSWERRFLYDVWYVDHWSMWLDVKIIGMTVIKVLRRDGVKALGSDCMPEFLGTRSQNHRV